MQAYFHYVEHLELIDAKKASYRATRLSTIAIFVATITFLVSVSMGFRDTRIANNQMQELGALKFNPAAIENHLKTLTNQKNDKQQQDLEALSKILVELKKHGAQFKENKN